MARRTRADRGSVSILAVFIVLFTVALGTFVYDAGYALRVANKADNFSAEAGRAALEAVGPEPGSSDPSLAVSAAKSYLAQVSSETSGYTVTSSVMLISRTRVQVEVTVRGYSPLMHISVTRHSTHVAVLIIGSQAP